MIIEFKKLNDTYVELIGSNEAIVELKYYFSFKADGYQFHPLYKFGDWDGSICLIEQNKYLPLGLLKIAIKHCVECKFNITIDQALRNNEEISKDEFDEWINLKKIYSKNVEINPYWYQLELVFKGINSKKILLNLPTLAGKSLIQALLSKYFIEHNDTNSKVLIIVPTVLLVKQMISDFVDYQLFNESDCLGILAGSSKDIKNKEVVVSTWQSASKQPSEWFDNFGMLLVDECHLLTGVSISGMTKKMVNCKYKIGLTGTVKDGKANILQYIGLFGDIYKPVSTKELMEAGQVSKLKVKAILLEYPDIERKNMKNKIYADEIKYITTHKQRNNIIAKLAIKLAKNNENVLIMFNNKDHGRYIEELIKINGYDNVFFINGSIKVDDREYIQKYCEQNTGVIVVSLYKTTSAGVSIKNMHHAIFAHPIKSKVTVLQTIGRTLRLHKSKDFAIMWDIIDNFGIKNKKDALLWSYTNYALKHGLDRIDRYNEEQFDYLILSLKI